MWGHTSIYIRDTCICVCLHVWLVWVRVHRHTRFLKSLFLLFDSNPCQSTGNAHEQMFSSLCWLLPFCLRKLTLYLPQLLGQASFSLGKMSGSVYCYIPSFISDGSEAGGSGLKTQRCLPGWSASILISISVSVSLHLHLHRFPHLHLYPLLSREASQLQEVQWQPLFNCSKTHHVQPRLGIPASALWRHHYIQGRSSCQLSPEKGTEKHREV